MVVGGNFQLYIWTDINSDEIINDDLNINYYN